MSEERKPYLPPTDIPPSELFRKLLERPRPSQLVDFPAASDFLVGRLRIQVLMHHEHDEVRETVQRYYTEKKKLSAEEQKSPLWAEVIADHTAAELLSRACVQEHPIPAPEGEPQVYPKVFADGLQVKKVVTSDELTVLWTLYQMIQRRFGPYEGLIASPEELNAWIEKLAVGASAFPLSQLSWHHLVDLAMQLAARAYECSGYLLSLRSSWPPSLAASLERLDIGSFSSGEPPSDGPGSGSTSTLAPALADRSEMTAEDAARVAENVFKRGKF